MGKLVLLFLASFLIVSPAFAEIKETQAVRAIIGEAGNQGYLGMVMVGEAIRNRGHLKGVYGLNAKHVDKEPKWVWDMAFKAWKESANSNYVNRADHWEAIEKYGKPKWAYSMTETARYKDHVFYRAKK